MGTTDPPADRKLMLVASTGGHVAELARLAPGLGAAPNSLWVTFDSAQTRSLLSGQRRLFVPYVRPRDVRGVMRTAWIVERLLRHEHFDGVVSTGSAIAVSALPLAAAEGIPSLYIESVSRVEGPSVSGRILAACRLVEMHTQHESWAHGRWQMHQSVFNTFRSLPKPPAERPSLFVTLGTIEGYRFDAMVDAVLATGLADERTVWQLGYTERDDLPGRAYGQMLFNDFHDAAENADVVVTHAGVGSLIAFLEAGIYPVLVTRRKARGEHVDDHQTQIAELASALGVVEAVDAPELTADVIYAAARRRVDPALPVGLGL
ncbi:glycosyltransferase [Glaciibacter sp. 2TAF33]|uniref:glycosyltransferase n=1 Tax=Glaciibacter sp. 2TAF33 TaxID=3233015 RepID=UPI003F934BE5